VFTSQEGDRVIDQSKPSFNYGVQRSILLQKYHVSGKVESVRYITSESLNQLEKRSILECLLISEDLLQNPKNNIYVAPGTLYT
jgi:hypothetical protein